MLDEYQREEALIHFQRGLHLERAHRVSEAVEEYRRAIARDPHLREAHDALGSYYQRRGLLAKAAEEFRVVASLDGDFLSYFNLGCVLLELGRYDDAQTEFERCLALQPGDAASSFELGQIAFLKGQYAAALPQLRLPLQQFPDDWEVHNLIGSCHLRLGAYDAALEAFGQALQVASDPCSQAQVIELIHAIDRYREFDALGRAKDRLYAEQGVIYLGSAQDDGLHIDEFQDYFFTYPDIGATLQRLLAVMAEFGWQFTSVVALDRQSVPLANVLAELLQVRHCYADAVELGELPLFVQGVGREAELLKLAVERALGPVVTFCLGLNWLRHSMVLPDMIGVVAHGMCSVPWESELRRLRCDGAAPEQIAACQRRATEQILQAMRECPLDAGVAQQVTYYRHHPNVRFASLLEPVLA